MRKDQRLRRRGDFAAVYRAGRSMGNQLLVVRVLANGGSTSRFGFVAGKVVGDAVVRNRVKRRLRAVAASLEPRPGIDIVISARKAAAGAPYERLAASLASLLGRAGARAPGSVDGAERASEKS